MATRPGREEATIEADAITVFADSLRGDVIGPDEATYDAVREIWNGLIDSHPALIVQCAGAADIAKCLAFAGEHDLPFSVRGGGHHQSGSSLIEDGLVIDLSGMTSVRVDPEAKVARVEPGCRVRDVLIEAQHYGLATPTGSAGDVGIPGSTLGGGIGWIRRKHGLGIDALRAVDIVTPDGELRHASRTQNEDLFWAIRGGGGNFGIVTSFEFDLYEVGPLVAGLGVFYPGEDAADVVKQYRALCEEAPAEVTTLLLNSHVPHLPPIPEELAGQDAVAILGGYAGDIDDGMAALQPFRELAEPILDMSEPMPYMLLHQLGTMMFPDGRRYCHRSCYVDELSDEIVAQVVAGTEAKPGPLSGIGVWHMGGAVSEEDNGAYPWRSKEYMLVIEANWDDPTADAAHLAWAHEQDGSFRKLGSVGAYGGFTGVSEQEGEDFAERVYGESFERLAEIKARYDPENTLSKNVNVTPVDHTAR